jgi:hypothetical protein
VIGFNRWASSKARDFDFWVNPRPDIGRSTADPARDRHTNPPLRQIICGLAEFQFSVSQRSICLTQWHIGALARTWRALFSRACSHSVVSVSMPNY